MPKRSPSQICDQKTVTTCTFNAGAPFSFGILTCPGLVDGRVAVLGDRLSGLVVCLARPRCKKGISISGDGYVVQSPLPFFNSSELS
jgi:hypothetical protein